MARPIATLDRDPTEMRHFRPESRCRFGGLVVAVIVLA
jgi:hypothetical protein